MLTKMKTLLTLMLPMVLSQVKILAALKSPKVASKIAHKQTREAMDEFPFSGSKLFIIH